MRNVLETPPAPSRATRRVILRARQIGRAYHLGLALVHHHLDTHGYPGQLAMRAPAHAARTLLAKLLEALLDGCGGSCNQGRRPCDCKRAPR